MHVYWNADSGDHRQYRRVFVLSLYDRRSLGVFCACLRLELAHGEILLQAKLSRYRRLLISSKPAPFNLAEAID
jgi:hypothetical protein